MKYWGCYCVDGVINCHVFVSSPSLHTTSNWGWIKDHPRVGDKGRALNKVASLSRLDWVEPFTVLKLCIILAAVVVLIWCCDSDLCTWFRLLKSLERYFKCLTRNLEMANEKDVRWTKEQTRKLIELIRSHECLWDTKLKDYKDQIKRRSAYKDIAAQLNMPVDSIKTKVHRLRAQHCGERNKLKKRQNVNCVENCNRSKWEYFEALNFLFSTNCDSNNLDNMDSDKRCVPETSNQSADIPDTESEDFQKETDLLDFTDEDLDMTDESLYAVCTTPIRQTSRPQKSRRCYTHERNRKSFSSRWTQVSNDTRYKDEDGIFAEYVISELKILNDDQYLKFKLRNGIKKLILEISEEHSKKRFLLLPETTSTLLTSSDVYTSFISAPQSTSSGHSFEILTSTTGDGKTSNLKHTMFDEDIDKILGK